MRTVDSRWCLVHATHHDGGRDRAPGAQRSGGGFLPDHRSESGRRHFPGGGVLGAGGAFGIGTDSNVRIDVSEELRQLEYSQRLRDRARNVVAVEGLPSTGRALFDGALRGGAQALGGPEPASVEGAAPTSFRST